jgi:hypothetical protein
MLSDHEDLKLSRQGNGMSLIRLMLFGTLTLIADLGLATDLAKDTHPGFTAYQAAEQKLAEIPNIEKSLPAGLTAEARKKQIAGKISELQSQAYDRCKISIGAYAAATADQIEISALYFCVSLAIESCEPPNEKPNCDQPIQNVVLIVQKQMQDKHGSAGLANLVGSHYKRKKRYADAMKAYYPAYQQFAKTPCTDSHTNQLLTILNLHLESGDKASFDQYWKMAAYCDTSGLLLPKGTKIVHDTTKNKVTLEWQPLPVAAVTTTTSTSTTTMAVAAIPKELPAKQEPVKTPPPEKVQAAQSATKEELVGKPTSSIPAPSLPTPSVPSLPPVATTHTAAAKQSLPLSPETTTAVSNRPPPTKTLPPVADNKPPVPASSPAAVHQEVMATPMEFVAAVLKNAAINHQQIESILNERKAKKNKDEKEARELDEIFKVKKENEQKAIDQMMSSDPDSRAKQLKNVANLQIGDSMEKVEKILGKPTIEGPEDKTLHYEQLSTGASVGDLIAGKMPPFVELTFAFNSKGQLFEMRFAIPEAGIATFCRDEKKASK